MTHCLPSRQIFVSDLRSDKLVEMDDSVTGSDGDWAEALRRTTAGIVFSEPLSGTWAGGGG